MTDDEKTAESAAGLIPEPGERRDPIAQIRERHAQRHIKLDWQTCSVCTLLAEIDRVQAQLGAVVEECAAIAENEPVAHGWDGKRWWHSGEKAAGKIRSLHPSDAKALKRRDLRNLILTLQAHAGWTESEVQVKIAALTAQLARLDNQKEQKP